MHIHPSLLLALQATLCWVDILYSYRLGYRVHPLDAMLLFDFPSSQHPEGRFDYTGPAALWPVYVTFI